VDKVGQAEFVVGTVVVVVLFQSAHCSDVVVGEGVVVVVAVVVVLVVQSFQL